jgi:hypothetical protein
MYTCTISLPGVAANNLCGPTLSVAVAFSALNATNVGFGIGWSLTTTRYDGPRKRLSLSSGGSFVVDTPSAKAPGDLRSRSTARAVEPFACRLSVVAVEFAVVFTAIVGVVFNVVDGRARDRRLDSGR